MAEQIFRVALCDDTAMEAQLLGELLAEAGGDTPGVRWMLAHFASAEALEQALAGGEAFDLCLLDIVLPGMDGLEFLRRQRGTGRALRVAVMSNSREYAREAAALGVMAYLVKPVHSAQLRALLDKVRRERAEEQENAVELPAPGGPLKVAGRDIIRLRRCGPCCRVYLAGGQEIEVGSGAAVEAALLALPGFAQVGGGWVANLAQVASLRPHHLVFRDGTALKIPRRWYQRVASAYMAFLADTKG